MIQIIMVLSTISLSSCTTMNSSLLSLEARPTTAATILRLTDDTTKAVPPTGGRGASFKWRLDRHDLILPSETTKAVPAAAGRASFKSRLDPHDLILTSELPSFTHKHNLSLILSRHSSGFNVEFDPLSKTSRRRRIYPKDRAKGDHERDSYWKSLLKATMADTVQPSSLMRTNILLHKPQTARTVKKIKQNIFRSTNISNYSFDSMKRESGRAVPNNSTWIVDVNNQSESLGNPVQQVSVIANNSHHTNSDVIDKKTSLYSHRNGDRVKRSVNIKQGNQEHSNESVTVSQNASVRNSAMDANTSTRRSMRSRNNTTMSNVASSDVSNVTSSSNRTTSKRGKRRRRGRRRHRQSKDLSMWIDERQVKLFSGYMMEIYAIHDGRILPYILDPNFEKHLPVIPFEVQSVNFTWQAGRKRYYYTFDRLYSHDPSILQAPVISLPTQGRIPRKPKVFTVNIHCTGNVSGIAAFDIGLLIQTRRGKPMPGTPLRLKLRKECNQPTADPECDQKCENGGVCDTGRSCQCPEGYMGRYCNTALCYPQCMNGGTCTTPGRCTCPPGYQGRHCICRDKCENGGKCIQKDTCACSRGYYGNRCEFSKCVIPCINGGRCRNVNKCRCPHGFAGDHCEIVTGRSHGATALARCSRKCRHGSCRGTSCHCQQGYTGRWCRRRGGNRKRIWL